MDLSDPVSAVIPTLEGQILRVLAATPQALTTSAVTRLVRRGSRQGVQVALHRLADVGTVTAEQVGSQYTYRANHQHAAWPAIQAVVDFTAGFASRFDAELSRLVDEAVDRSAGNVDRALVTCAVFGSVARRTATADSDVDLVLVLPDDTPADLGEDVSRHLSEGVESFTGNRTNVVLLTRTQRDAMVERGDPLVRSWREDARTVHGPHLLPETGS